MLSQFDAPLNNNNNQQQQQSQSQLYPFDFVNADDFLDSISGALPTNNNNNEIVFDNINSLNPNIYSPISAISGDDLEDSNVQNLNLNYTGQNFNDYLSDNSLECYDNKNQQQQQQQQQPQQVQQQNGLDLVMNTEPNKRSGSTSTNSSIQHDNTTPISHYSAESILTSPEPPMLKKEEIPYIKQNITATSSAATVTGKKSSKVTKPKSKDKNSHNMIEKKYRTNINTKILALRDAVPSLRIAAGCEDVSIADLEGLTPASKLNKASVLTKATEYIKHLETKNAILRQQNMELQRLIQQANLNHPQAQALPPPPPPQQQQQQQQPTTANAPQQPGFGFYPQQDQSFNSAPVSQFSSPQQPQSHHQQQQQQQPNRFLLGGMAAVMGTSLFGGSGENDFRSLSALPFSYLFPNAILNPSPMTIQLWNLTKILLIIGSLANIFIPMYHNYKHGKKDDDKKLQNCDSLTMIDFGLISCGVKHPYKLSSTKRELILSNLQNGGSDWMQLVSDYFYLTCCEINFENCFLVLVLGNMIRFKYTKISPIMNHYLMMKNCLILNLDYKGSNKSLIKLNQLIGKIDGVSMFNSENLFKRLINIFTNQVINDKINDGQNYVKYIEFYQDASSDYYEIILNWRLLEIIHELNLTYLEDLNEDDKNQILTDLKIMEAFINDDDCKIYKNYQLFNSVLNANYSPYLFESLKNKVEVTLEKFRIGYEGIDLTDHEIYNTSSEEEDDEQEPEEEEEKRRRSTNKNKSLRLQKNLISSLNLVNDEEFIILTSSLIIYYYKNKEYEKSIKLLNYLKINEKDNFSLLTFTSLISLINELIPGNLEDNDILDLIIKNLRNWINLNGNNVFDESLRLKLTKLIVNKSMIVNGINVNEAEYE
ncbi:CPH2 Transcription factor CPH2 [Candida maltosa Xu316]